MSEPFETFSKPVTDLDFHKSVENGLSVVKFWQDNCEPCEMVRLMFEDVAYETPDVKFFSAKKNEVMAIGEELGLKRTPTFVIYRDGQLVTKIEKQVTARYLKEAIEKARTAKPAENVPTLEQAFAEKGRLITEIEINQEKLRQVNDFIASQIKPSF